jgi:hypothetical protein
MQATSRLQERCADNACIIIPFLFLRHSPKEPNPGRWISQDLKIHPEKVVESGTSGNHKESRGYQRQSTKPKSPDLYQKAADFARFWFIGNVYPQTGYLRLFDDVQQKFQLCREGTRLSDSREKGLRRWRHFLSPKVMR